MAPVYPTEQSTLRNCEDAKREDKKDNNWYRQSMEKRYTNSTSKKKNINFNKC